MKNKPYRYWLYLAARVLAVFFRCLPRRIVLGTSAVLGSLTFILLKEEREKTLAHLKMAYGESKTGEELGSIARRVFVHCAKAGADWVLYPRYNRSNWRKIVHWTDEFDRVNRLLELGKGIIMVTGHFGNWEMIAATFTLFGYSGGVVARRIYYEPYNQWIVATRLSKGVRTFYRDDSPKGILKALKANQIIGIVADQDVDSIEGVFIPFFGQPAYTPAAPAKLSLATGAPIVPVFLIRGEDDTYHLVLEEPIFADPGAEKASEIERLTRLWNSAIEKYVRSYPDQWVWMHRRWKTRPRLAALSEGLLTER